MSRRANDLVTFVFAHETRNVRYNWRVTYLSIDTPRNLNQSLAFLVYLSALAQVGVISRKTHLHLIAGEGRRVDVRLDIQRDASYILIAARP